MDRAETLFLEALRCAIRGESVPWNEMPEQETLRRLFRHARHQNVLPLVAQALSGNALFTELPLFRYLKKDARDRTLFQAARTGDFLLVLEQLRARGLHPAVLKGAVCRSLYPEPEQRFSSDEDLLVPPEQVSRYHEALLAAGLSLKDPGQPLKGEDEITYVDPRRNLCIELHLRPFPTDDHACGDLNRPFEGALSRIVPLRIYGFTIETLSPTDHLLFLLCHAYKHILYGGVGIRQICDLCLFSERYAESCDWTRIRALCGELGILHLAAAFFQIGQQYLGVPCPAAFSDVEVDVLPLLADCFSGGLYGVDDPDRHHSTRITLDAVAASRQGRARRDFWSSLFPGVRYLQASFPYARSHPALVPVAWAHRLLNYLSRGDLSASKSLQIGRERVELLRRYKIIP